MRLGLTWIALALLGVGCSGDDAGGGGGNAASAMGSGGTAPGSGTTGSGTAPGRGMTGGDPAMTGGSGEGSPGGTQSVEPPNGNAAALANKLNRHHFLIGMGNDLADDHDQDGAYTLGVTLDLHYAYLVGLLGMGGWPDWNADGSFVNILADSADRNGVVPMYTLYSMAAWGEANLAVLTDDGYMQAYWDGAKLLFERIAIFGKPAVVQLEPDFWAFAQHQEGGDPAAIDVHVSSLAPDCSGQPDNLIGMGQCLVLLARMHAPLAVVGFHASGWASPDPSAIADYLVQIGADESDFVTLDMLDRDAGCFEAHLDEACQRDDGPWYWDETNQSSPNFHEHFAMAKQIADGTGKPILWWQLPFGVPSDAPGGSAGHYRDNRVKYIFEHIDELIAAGGVGAAFGVGAGNQTYITTDGDQFKNAVTEYYASPVRW